MTVHCSKGPRSHSEALNNAWREILEKYEKYDIQNDTGSMVGAGDAELDLQLDSDSVSFGLVAHAGTGPPEYEEQYQAWGKCYGAFRTR